MEVTNAPVAEPAPQEGAAPAPAPYLHPGGPTEVEGRIDGARVHRYALELAAGDYLQAVAEQRGADVVLTLVDPAGQKLVEMDSPTAGWGPERIAAVATVAGVHHLEVRPLPDGAAGGYLLRIESRKPAGPADRRTARGYQRFQEGLAQVQQERYDLARRSFGAAAQDWTAARHPYGEALASFQVAGTWFLQGLAEEALAAYATALPKLEAAGLAALASEALYLVGDLHRLGERHAEALAHYRDALGYFRSVGNRAAEASLRNQMGLAHSALSQSQEALAAYAGAAELWQELGQREKLALSLHNRAKVLLELGDYTAALADLGPALELYREAGDEVGRAEVLYAMGQVHQRRSLAPAAGTRRRDLAARDHDLERALELFAEALSVLRAHGAEGELVGAVLLESGKCKAELDNAADALADLRRAETIFRHQGPVRNLGLTELELGTLALHRDDAAAATRYFRQALGRFEEIGDPAQRMAALGWLGLTRQRVGDLAAASDLLEEALGLLEELRRSPDSFGLRSTFLASRQNYYEVYIDVLMERHAGDPSAGHDRRALEIHERSRARALLEQVDDSGEDTGLIDPLDVGEIQRSVLDPGALLAAYHLGSERSVLWLLSADRLDTYTLPPRDRVETLALEAHTLMSSPPARRGAYRLRHLRAELGRLLLEPAAERLLEAERLVVVPSGALHYLPFAALPDPGSGDPLIGRL